MNNINPYAYTHIWPRVPAEDVMIWHCGRCNESAVVYASQLTAGNGLTDLILWATNHTGSDCTPTEPPRPRLRDHHQPGTTTAPELRARLATDTLGRDTP